MYSANSKVLLETAVAKFFGIADSETAQLIYKLYYEQEQVTKVNGDTVEPLDLAFNDGMLDDVEEEWRLIMEDQDDKEFMRFEERAGMNPDEDDNDMY